MTAKKHSKSRKAEVGLTAERIEQIRKRAGMASDCLSEIGLLLQRLPNIEDRIAPVLALAQWSDKRCNEILSIIAGDPIDAEAEVLNG